jgi:hypothetical protein
MPLGWVGALDSEWKPIYGRRGWRGPNGDLRKGSNHQQYQENSPYKPAALIGCGCKPLPSKVKTLTSS